MARLQKGEREVRENALYRLLKRLRFGVRESEIAQELGWQRRTAKISEFGEHYMHCHDIQ